MKLNLPIIEGIKHISEHLQILIHNVQHLIKNYKACCQAEPKNQTPVYLYSLKLLVSLPGMDAPELMVAKILRSRG